jgi:hypothetical protein
MSESSEAINDEPIMGQFLSPEEEALAEWSADLIRETPKQQLENFKQLITFNLAMIAGSVAFFQNMTPTPRVLMLLANSCSFVLSLYGMMPNVFVGNTLSFEDIRDNRNRVVKRRHSLIWGAAVLIVLAVAFACIGAITQPIIPPAPPPAPVST